MMSCKLTSLSDPFCPTMAVYIMVVVYRPTSPPRCRERLLLIGRCAAEPISETVAASLRDICYPRDIRSFVHK